MKKLMFVIVAMILMASCDNPFPPVTELLDEEYFFTTGTVMDENGEPVIGATVEYAGKYSTYNQGLKFPDLEIIAMTTTDEEGKFYLQVKQDDTRYYKNHEITSQHLIISHPNFQTQGYSNPHKDEYFPTGPVDIVLH